MNKVILSLLLAVCILGMALIMLNERLGRKTEPAPAPSAEISQPAAPSGGAELPPLSADDERNAFTAPPETARQEPALPPLPQGEAEAPIFAAGQATERSQTFPASSAAPAAQTAGGEDAGVSAPSAAAQRPAPSARAESAAPARDAAKKNERPAPSEKPKAEKAGAEKAKTEKSPAPHERSISRFVVFARDRGATVRLTGNAPLRYKSMNLNNPERVVVDLEGQWQINAPGVPANPLVSNVRVGKMGDKTRVVIDLKEKARATRLLLAKDGKTLDVRVDQ